MLRRLLFLGLLVLQLGPHSLLAQTATSEENLWSALRERTPWVFLGDSNTYAGGYIAILDAWLASESPRPKVLNLGVASETASGLSETDHPFQRPCVHERVSKVLSMTKPGVVFICYGMNDGIYQPPQAEVMQAYQQGMLALAEKVRASGALLVCITPPPFEAAPVKASGKLGPTREGRYAYFAPAADYDRVIQQQSQWCRENAMGAVKVVDIHVMLQHERELRREQTPSFAFSKDGVHFGSEAHALVAERLLIELGAPQDMLEQYPTNAQIEVSAKKMRILRDAYLSATGKNRPGLPAGLPIWYAEQLASQQTLESPAP